MVTGSIQVLRADHLGMCFGVRDAIALAMHRAESAPLTILGDLVHNAAVLADLRSRGIVTASDPAGVTTPVAMVTAHGASERMLARARSAETEKRVRSATAAFYALQVTQRPTFVLDSNIGDRAVFSGFWRLDPLVAAIESMLADANAYNSWKAHFGDPPPH